MSQKSKSEKVTDTGCVLQTGAGGFCTNGLWDQRGASAGMWSTKRLKPVGGGRGIKLMDDFVVHLYK